MKWIVFSFLLACLAIAFRLSFFGKPKDVFLIKDIKLTDYMVEHDVNRDNDSIIVVTFNLQFEKAYQHSNNSELIMFPGSREKGINGVMNRKVNLPSFQIICGDNKENINSLVQFDSTELKNACCGVSNFNSDLTYQKLKEMFVKNDKRIRGTNLSNVKIPFKLIINNRECLLSFNKRVLLLK